MFAGAVPVNEIIFITGELINKYLHWLNQLKFMRKARRRDLCRSERKAGKLGIIAWSFDLFQNLRISHFELLFCI